MTRKGQKRKRKILEDDYDHYSSQLKSLLLNGAYSLEDANILYDRAITCFDLANIYFLNDKNENAIDYLKSAINDLEISSNIYARISNSQKSIEKCKKLQRVCSQHITNINIESSYESDYTSNRSSSNSEATDSPVSISPQKKEQTNTYPNRQGIFSNDTSNVINQNSNYTSTEYSI